MGQSYLVVDEEECGRDYRRHRVQLSGRSKGRGRHRVWGCRRVGVDVATDGHRLVAIAVRGAAVLAQSQILEQL